MKVIEVGGGKERKGMTTTNSGTTTELINGFMVEKRNRINIQQVQYTESNWYSLEDSDTHSVMNSSSHGERERDREKETEDNDDDKLARQECKSNDGQGRSLTGKKCKKTNQDETTL